jgi:hypothetical protein
MPRLSIASPYQTQASSAVNTASRVSMSDALAPLVRCKPQARATGPSTAPMAAIPSKRGRSRLPSAASWLAGFMVRSAMPAAPRYSSAAVENGPMATPNRWTNGVLRPNRTAEASASPAPRAAGPFN